MKMLPVSPRPSVIYPEQPSLLNKMSSASELTGTTETSLLPADQISSPVDRPSRYLHGWGWLPDIWILLLFLQWPKATLVSFATSFPQNNKKRELVTLCWEGSPSLSLLLHIQNCQNNSRHYKEKTENWLILLTGILSWV